MSAISGATKVCMVIGDPVAHTLSPRLHNAAYEACGLSHKYVYVAAQVTPAHLKEALDGIRALGVRGVSVTIPYKSAVLPYLDQVDPSAWHVGAVNTIVNDGGKLIGYNTDISGILIPLEAQTALSGKRIALIGAGGAARAAAFAVTSKGASLAIFNRTREHAEELAKAVNATAHELTELDRLSEFDIILQSTSVGMTPHGDESPIPESYIQESHLVFDFVYTPLETKLLATAKRRGARTISGIEMFLHQGAAQFELYTEQKAPLEIMRETLLRVFEKT